MNNSTVTTTTPTPDPLQKNVYDGCLNPGDWKQDLLALAWVSLT